ncbi:MAG TPA: hypothetical protein HA326_02910 [Thermoplasmata archaeon]|nr:hypothetical protein [Thermoplasmata archaeon]
MARKTRKDKSVTDWLLGEDQPAIRYLTLTQLLGRPEDDPAVREARGAIATKGFAAEILGRQNRGGWWVSPESFYRPKYLSSNWMLLILADLGMTREDPRIKRAADEWIRRFAKEDGGFGMDGSKSSHLCVVGNTARALVEFGYTDHPKVARAFEWMEKNRSHLGGWSCFGSGRNLDSWEPMSAFAVYPRSKWTAGMRRAVEEGAEFFLQRELHRQGDPYEPWNRFHYPIHYYYDLLVGLDFMTDLGYEEDPRLRHALSVLRKKRRNDGRWTLDAVHPDIEGASKEWYEKHPKDAPTPFALEEVGKPSKMVTLRAMRVLHRLSADD